MNFWALITVNKPRVLAKLLVKTTFRSLLGMEEKRLVLNTNLASTHDIRMLTSAWAKQNSLEDTPRLTYRSFAIAFDAVMRIRHILTKRKTFDTGRSLLVLTLTEPSLIKLMLRFSLCLKLFSRLMFGWLFHERWDIRFDCGISLDIWLRNNTD